MIKKISDKDKKDWENFLSKDDKLIDKDDFKKKQNRGKIKTLDLHGHTLEGANHIVEKFIINSFEKNVSKLVVVTGKGLHSDNDKDPFISKELGILKFSVPNFIKNNPELMSMIYEIKDASIEDGGSGAFYIFLKKN